MAGFKWGPKPDQAAIALASGKTHAQAAKDAGCGERTIRNWLQDLEFVEEVDRLSLMVGIASRAARLRYAQRVALQLTQDDGTLITTRDLLEWLKFAQSETDGAKLDLTRLHAALNADDAPLAD